MVFQYRPEWSGTSGGPGVTVLNARLGAGGLLEEQQFADFTRAWYLRMVAFFPTEITFTFPAEVTELNTTTGVLESVVSVNAPDPVTGTSAGVYAAPAGARVDWHTGAIVDGKRLRGRTYLVPITTGAYDGGGTLLATAINDLTADAVQYLSDMDGIGALGVWSRTHGVIADVSSVNIPDEVAVLRSRRD